MAVGWQGDRIQLAPLDQERHFENICAWINDPEVTDWIMVGDFPMGALAEQEWFNSHLKFNEKDVVLAIELLDGTHIGQTGIHGIDLRHGFASTGSYIGDPSQRGKGYGTEASKLRAWYCFHVLGLRLIMSGYLEGNERSKAMNENCGYTEYGRVPKQFWKRGQYRDHIETVLTRERWLELSGGNKNW
ncbi:MAG: GNAT family N-acetyltransferase [Fimbriimonadaceae bacterium]|nr:MAG: GNAT family N-acetyltransferase [Fimbriimonadaceae bacterium]